MHHDPLPQIASQMNAMGQFARAASRAMAAASTAKKNQVLADLAQRLNQNRAALVQANLKDIKAAEAAGSDAAFIDRLKLNDKVIDGMIAGVKQIHDLADPIGEISGLQQQPSGIRVGRMRVPIGVIGIIYESRPNVTVDAAALCIKAGNATVLRGGSEAFHSNTALAELIGQSLAAAGLPSTAVQCLQTTDREAVGAMINTSMSLFPGVGNPSSSGFLARPPSR
jgi:glutamate-5-semialdehyde dehydrogenase